jgi:glycosyltransferase involved in cell wall biosynthesis
VSSIKYFNNINVKLFYCVFLSNIYNNIDWIEKFKIPFVFTLYPGGGFQVNSQIINKKLNRVFSSPMFRKVIVTQKYTKNYLIDDLLCDPNKIEFIFGCVVPQTSIRHSNAIGESFNRNKDFFDIVFCAAKYTEKGEDKGYDTFIDFAKSISGKYSFVRFHIIGGFDENVIDITSIRDKINFYGYKKFEELAAIFKKMDIIISPNKPFLLHDGAFDGFPLGTVVEAVLNGVVALVSDELNENEYFENEKDIILIKNDKFFIERKVEYLIGNPKILDEISNNGRNKFSELYSNDIQMKRRIDILKNEVFKN